MEEKNKLGTLDAMTQESFTARPKQAPDAVEEYLDNINSMVASGILNPELSVSLTEKLSNTKYHTQFKTAITQTSLMVFIAAYKATQPDDSVKFDKYIAEYMFFARQDDNDIYNMRLFYLEKLNAQEMGIGQNPSEENLSVTEEALIRQEVLRVQQDYDNMVNTLKEKYKEKSTHLSDNAYFSKML
jgi:hypothetical protein